MVMPIFGMWGKEKVYTDYLIRNDKILISDLIIFQLKINGSFNIFSFEVNIKLLKMSSLLVWIRYTHEISDQIWLIYLYVHQSHSRMKVGKLVSSLLTQKLNTIFMIALAHLITCYKIEQYFLTLIRVFLKLFFFSLLRHILLLLLLFHYIILCLLMICLLMIYLTVCHCNCVSSISELLTFTKKGFQNTA